MTAVHWRVDALNKALSGRSAADFESSNKGIIFQIRLLEDQFAIAVFQLEDGVPNELSQLFRLDLEGEPLSATQINRQTGKSSRIEIDEPVSKYLDRLIWELSESTEVTHSRAAAIGNESDREGNSCRSFF